MKNIPAIFPMIISAFLVGCASTLVQLNDPSRSQEDVDRANLLKERSIPYETAIKDGVAVSYNLMTDTRSHLIRLTLLMKNEGASPLTISPKVTLLDADGIIVEPYSYNGFVQQAAIMAGTQVPMIPATVPSNTYSSGTITNMGTGTTYSYYGNTTAAPNFAQSFSQGFNQGAAMAAVANRRNGQMMMQWANTYWLKSGYDLPAKGTAVGGLFYQSRTIRLPAKLTVDINNTEFEFTTRAN